MEHIAAFVAFAGVLPLPGVHDGSLHMPVALPFAGHVEAVPLHTAAIWQVTIGPQTVPAAFFGLAGHVPDEPVHVAACMSQGPGVEPHIVVLGLNALSGHSVPSHTSATSHTPAAARHVVPAGTAL